MIRSLGSVLLGLCFFVPRLNAGEKDLAALAEKWAETKVGGIIAVSQAGQRTYQPIGRIKTPLGDHAASPQTLFEIGSISKAFAGILLADAVNRGEVKLNDPANLHLPEPYQLKFATGHIITLRHLATHRSGMPVEPPLIGLLAKKPNNPYADYTPEKLSKLLARERKLPPPGEKYQYSNLAAGLLGHALVHRARADDFDHLLKDRLARPLNLKDTAEALTGEQKSRLAQGHNKEGEPTPNWDFATLVAAGGIRSTAADLLTLAEASMAGTKLTPIIQESMKEQEPVSLGTTIGLCWHRTMLTEGSVAIWHNGQTMGYQSMLAIDQVNKRAIVILLARSDNKDVEKTAFDWLKKNRD